MTAEVPRVSKDIKGFLQPFQTCPPLAPKYIYNIHLPREGLDPVYLMETGTLIYCWQEC